MGFPAYLDIILGVCICVGFIAACTMILACMILLRMLKNEQHEDDDPTDPYDRY